MWSCLQLFSFCLITARPCASFGDTGTSHTSGYLSLQVTSRGLSTSGNEGLRLLGGSRGDAELSQSMGTAPADGGLSSMCRDGIPPYRIGSKKQLQREMHRSVKANGQVSLPHFPVSPGGSCRVWVGHGKCWGWGQAHEEGREQGRRAFPSHGDARGEVMLGVGQEPCALSIVPKPCLCTVTSWSFLKPAAN